MDMQRLIPDSSWVQHFIHEGRTAIAVSAFILGCGTFVLYPICVSHVNDKIADAERVRASGLLILLQSLGMIGGPIVVSFFYATFRDNLFCTVLLIVCRSIRSVCFAFCNIQAKGQLSQCDANRPNADNANPCFS